MKRPAPKRLVFLESSDIGVKYSGRAARALGFEPLFLCELRHYQADPRAQLGEFEVIDCDTLDLSELRRVLAGVKDIAAVTTFADTRLRVACELAEELGVRGVDPRVRPLKDKSAVQRLVPEYSPETLSFHLDDVPLEELAALLARSSSIVIKPIDAAGALGLMQIDRAQELESLNARPELQHVPEALLRGPWIAQTFIRGDLISVEGFVREGRVRILGISRRKKVGATESASTFPADHTLLPEARRRAIDAVIALIERSGFRNGYLHVEFIVEGRRCVMIDANMGRIGGGAVAEQLALAYGHEPVEIFQHVLLTSLFPERAAGLEMYSRPIAALCETYAILYGLENGGLLREVRLPAGKVPPFHTQVLGSGAEVSPMGRDDWSWIGIISGRTGDALRTAAEIEIVTDQGSFKPYY